MKAKEIAEIYGLTPLQVGKIRKKVCNEEDYLEKTRHILPSGVKKIKEYLNKKDSDALTPKFVRVQVIDSTPNPMFFNCKLLEKPVKKVRVSVPYTHTNLMRRGLIFKAQVITKNDEDFYRHEIIHTREINRQKRIQEIHK